jgi:hypothetical protein
VDVQPSISSKVHVIPGSQSRRAGALAAPQGGRGVVAVAGEEVDVDVVDSTVDVSDVVVDVELLVEVGELVDVELVLLEVDVEELVDDDDDLDVQGEPQGHRMRQAAVCSGLARPSSFVETAMRYPW